MSLQLIRKGAEASLYLGKWLGRNIVIKKRLPKEYRVPELDSRIRAQRTVHEAQILHTAKRLGVSVPVVYEVDEAEASFTMSFLPGSRLKEALDEGDGETSRIFQAVGRYVGRLHEKGVIHGDLTTSNVILCGKADPFLIDFGLSFYSDQLEDMGVDIHLMKRTLYGFHHAHADKWFRCFVRGYQSVLDMPSTAKVLRKVREIERRGRYFTGRQVTAGGETI